MAERFVLVSASWHMRLAFCMFLSIPPTHVLHVCLENPRRPGAKGNISNSVFMVGHVVAAMLMFQQLLQFLLVGHYVAAILLRSRFLFALRLHVFSRPQVIDILNVL